MRSKFTLVLLALNLSVFGYLLFSERPWSATQRIEENRRRVLGPEAANLAAIDITVHQPPASPTTDPASPEASAPAPSAAPASHVRLERRGKSWFLSAPIDWPANDYAVEPILTGLQFLEHETSFPVAELERNGQTLADYGLDHPRLVVTCTPAVDPAADASAPAPEPFTLRVGQGAEVGNRVYVLSPDGRRIHVVAAGIREALTLDVARLRSEQLLSIPVFEARALTLQTSAGRTRLRREQDRWAFEAPIVARAAQTPVEITLNDLSALRVARFLPASPALAPAATGLDKPAFRATLEGNARRETLLLGRPVEEPAPGAETVEFYARVDERPALFTVAVPAPLLKTLGSPLVALRDPRVLDLDPARVASVSVSAPGRPELRIQKLDAAAAGPAGWQLLSPDLAAPLRADPALVGNLLLRLKLLEASAPDGASPYVSDNPSDTDLENLGFKRPERVVTIEFDRPPASGAAVASQPALALELAFPGGATPGLFARVVGQPFIYSVPPDTLDHFPVVPRVLRDRELSRLPESTRVTRLVLRRAGASDTPPLLDYTPAEGVKPSEAVATLLATVRDLRAQRIDRETYPATVLVDGVEKPWAYTLEATLDPLPPDGSFVLSLAERSGGMTQLAGSKDLGLVFTLEQPVLDALWTLLYPAKDQP